MKIDNGEVLDTRPRRKMKPRSRWKKYRRPGKGELLTQAELARALGETPRTIMNWPRWTDGRSRNATVSKRRRRSECPRPTKGKAPAWRNGLSTDLAKASQSDRRASSSIVDELRNLLGADAVLLPIPRGEKGPRIKTFALDGPAKCSGLPVVRYDEASILAELGSAFVFRESRREAHTTPWQTQQPFIYIRFQHFPQ